jgi:hypothetical protein
MINKRDKDLLILLISRPWSIAISRRDNQKEAASFDAASFFKI